jgi:hypothetical protein
MHTFEILGSQMALLDEDGNGCECHDLASLREAKRQLGRRINQYAFLYAEALSALSEYFSTRQPPPPQRKKTMKTRRYTEKKLETRLCDLLNRVLSRRGGDAATFEECGILTNNRGLVLTLPGGQEFQMTIVRSR